MVKNSVYVCAAFLLLSFVTIDSANAQSRSTLKSDFGLELLGKAALYSFNYQYMVSPLLGLEAGLGALGGSATDGSVIFVPVGGRLYFVPKDGSPFVTGGLVYLTGQSDAGPLESATYGYAGLGIEYRSQGGLLFRGTAYGLISDGEFFIWPGLNIGYAF